MVWVAVVNLTMILFDLTYLHLRPTYLRVLPPLVRLYDPVKGIRPNPVTEGILEEARAARRLLSQSSTSSQLDAHIQHLRELSRSMLEDNPFERAGLGRNLEIIKVIVSRAVGVPRPALQDHRAVAATFDAFWSTDPAALGRHLAIFEKSIAPLLAANYARGFDLDGQLEDHFWEIDLPFLALFWVEFAVRWGMALRRRTYPRWFFFPMANWYDLLGLVPNRHFRVFRLFRVASIYVRLRRSDRFGVGKDPISRTVAYLASIISEEISDMVAIRILSELQEEIRAGTHLSILGDTLAHRRTEIESTVVDQLRTTLAAAETRNHVNRLYAVALERAASRDGPLASLPLPNALVRPLVHAVGDTLFTAVLDTVVATLESEEGRRATDQLVAAVVDDVFRGAGLDQLEHVGRDVTLEIIDRMKAAVAVKKWAQPQDSPVAALEAEAEPDA